MFEKFSWQANILIYLGVTCRFVGIFCGFFGACFCLVFVLSLVGLIWACVCFKQTHTTPQPTSQVLLQNIRSSLQILDIADHLNAMVMKQR